jgi:hypothetical protein
MGQQLSYQIGKLHRIDDPAIEKSDGSKSWYFEGKLHRLDGPAIINSDGTYWYQGGLRHRLDGPAVEYINGTKEWWLHGNRDYFKFGFPKDQTQNKEVISDI